MWQASIRHPYRTKPFEAFSITCCRSLKDLLTLLHLSALKIREANCLDLVSIGFWSSLKRHQAAPAAKHF